MQDNVISVRFDDPARAHEALRVLEQAARNDHLRLHAAVTVQVHPDGEVRVGELEDAIPEGLTRGSVLGGVVGMLGGPLGALVGWGIGARLGADEGGPQDVREEDALIAAVAELPVGSTALVAEIEEDEPEKLDLLLERLGGHVVRRPTDDVLDDVEHHVRAGDVEDADPHASRASRADRIAELQRRIEGRPA